jgi:O-antigen/teichoic acid export membrane protein
MLRLHAALLFATGLIGTVILFLWGEPFFAIVFGERWRPAGSYAAWLVIAFVGELAKLPAACLMQVIGKLAALLLWELGIDLVRYGFVLTLLTAGYTACSIAAFSFVGLAGWLLCCIIALRDRY